jgi:hypothetical protein
MEIRHKSTKSTSDGDSKADATALAAKQDRVVTEKILPIVRFCSLQCHLRNPFHVSHVFLACADGPTVVGVVRAPLH